MKPHPGLTVVESKVLPGAPSPQYLGAAGA